MPLPNAKKEEIMEKIQFDAGQRSYRINGAGTLRFNPCDPNVYSRFLEAVEKLQAVEEELTRQEALRQLKACQEGDISDEELPFE